MPSFKTAGKSKEDLSLVAQLAGLLTADETRVMTRTQLVRFLEKENEKVEQAEHQPVREAEPEPLRVRKPRTKAARETSAMNGPVSEPAEVVQESAVVPVSAPIAVDASEPFLVTKSEPFLVTESESLLTAAPEQAGVRAAEPVIIELPMEPVVRRTPGRRKAAAAVVEPTVPVGSPDGLLAMTIPLSKDEPDLKKRVRRISRAALDAVSESMPEKPESVEPEAKQTAQSAVEQTIEPENGEQTIESDVGEKTIKSDVGVQTIEPTASGQVEAPPRTSGRRAGPGRPKASAAAEPTAATPEVVKVKKKPGRKPGSGRKQKTETSAGQIQIPAVLEAAVQTGPVQAPERDLRRKPGRKSRIQSFGPDLTDVGEREQPAAAAGEDPVTPPVQRRSIAYKGKLGDHAQPVDTTEQAVSLVEAKSANVPDSAESSPEAAGAADDQTLTAADHQNMRTEQGSHHLSQVRAEMNRHGSPQQNMRPRTGIQRTRPLTPGQFGPDQRRDQDRSRQGGPDDQRTGSADSDRPRRDLRAPGSAAGPTGTAMRPSGTTAGQEMPSDTGANQVMQDDQGDALASAALRTAEPAVRVDGEILRERRPIVDTGEPQGGVLEIMPDGYGFLRKDNYLQGNKDIYVPPQYIRRFGLRPGDYITGPVRLQRETDRYQALLYIKDVNGQPPEKMLHRPHFDRLTPIYPDERFVLETVRNELSTRIIDLVAPIGKGQRGMIVSPPKAGKTILLQKIANAISVNNPDTKLIVLLIDERPEEVTDMQRSINGEVVYSTFDKTPENHTKVVELVLERAMRLVELKQDVIILLDSMTRLARAYNLTINPTGRTLSGGLDPGALYGPKRFFGAARNIENGGSLTIIATSLIETGSRMDEVIFEEFKGTGNMEVYLDRKLSEKRIFPAIDINKSGTRREELLMNTKELDAVWTIRKAFSQLDTSAVTEAIINLLLKTKNNEHFISSVNVSFNDKNVFDAMRGVRPGTQNTQPGSAGSGERTNPGSNPGGYGYGGSYNNTGYGSNYRRTGTNDDD